VASVKVLSLNVQSGGGRRWSAILDFVGGHDPEVGKPGVGGGAPRPDVAYW